jgi:hypothetical protein
MRMRAWICTSIALLSVSAVSYADGAPKVEVAGGYSYVNFHPGIPKITSQNLNGGGVSFVYNVMPLIGVKADFEAYAFGTGFTTALQNAGYPASVSISGNLFTYLFGPQFKIHHGKFEPFGEVLFGASHSNGYGTLLKQVYVSGTNPVSTASSSGNGFSMEFGGGLDIPVHKHVEIRPVEVDFLLTHYGATNYSAYQKNFKYFGGLNFTF